MSKILQIVALCLTLPLGAQDTRPNKKLPVSSSAYNQQDKPVRTLYNINNIAGWIYHDGRSGHSPGGDPGVWYPRGTGSFIYADGIIWGGYVRDMDPEKPPLRLGGSTYLSGLRPGRIISPGVAQSEDDPDVRIYRIRD